MGRMRLCAVQTSGTEDVTTNGLATRRQSRRIVSCVALTVALRRLVIFTWLLVFRTEIYFK